MAEDPSGLGLLIDGFGAIGTRLHWFCPPSQWEVLPGKSEGQGGAWRVDEEGRLLLTPPSKKDFWRKTYYTPRFCKDDGPCLFATVAASETVTVETELKLQHKRQFDQAGVCVRLDHEHWIKAGIECVDGKPQLSCVVTNVYSDWSTQPWHEAALKIRVHKIGTSDYVVEACSRAGDEWTFIRIAHLSLHAQLATDPLASLPCSNGPPAPASGVWMGVFACCPEEQEGCTATFHNFSIRRGTSFAHNADGNNE